ncbi:uncharacterized protein PITG_13902 [Phytophthora infestans T30-4]|uniref:Uncharacterized protein n=1 Tax=Phytophthora infestans (strain T30-4) TaxID=403677 RepID=D0NN22_PHYIT|nr:uncharacterized protein PITG_13902 [Phytophthora infestans T30-4]EEY61929.1 hypothetical protein PITG_13902 [Phytophthora infestans T30-4]|eukprot:XP_002899569.1 hypothetical protein PITG_13902 [Phytophthora infestans T30-4]
MQVEHTVQKKAFCNEAVMLDWIERVRVTQTRYLNFSAGTIGFFGALMAFLSIHDLLGSAHSNHGSVGAWRASHPP